VASVATEASFDRRYAFHTSQLKRFLVEHRALSERLARMPSRIPAMLEMPCQGASQPPPTPPTPPQQQQQQQQQQRPLRPILKKRSDSQSFPFL